MSKYSPTEINTSLSALVDHTCATVQNLTTKLDLKSDAEELKYVLKIIFN